MSKKLSNRTLFLILGALVVIITVTNMVRKKKQASQYRTELVTIDTSLVNEIKIYPASAEEEITISNSTGVWTVSNGTITAPLQESVIGPMLIGLINAKPTRLAAKSPEGWAKYELTDSAATRVVVSEAENGQTLDMYLGKFTYQQQTIASNQFNQQPQITGTTYVRLAGDDEAYAINGFLAMTFNQEFNSFRDASFLKANRDDIGNIQFNYPGDSSFVLIKTPVGWVLNNEPADSASVAQYVSMLANLPNRDFADEFQPATNPAHSISIDVYGKEPILVSCFPSNGLLYLSSSLNPGVYFESDSAGTWARLFLGASNFKFSQ